MRLDRNHVKTIGEALAEKEARGEKLDWADLITKASLERVVRVEIKK